MLATNAYTGEIERGLAPEIAREIVPALSWQMATAPLSDNVRRTVLPDRPAMSDTHGELYFARYDARHRLVTGGALLNPINGAERLKPYIAARLERLFPQIGAVQFDHVWNGMHRHDARLPAEVPQAWTQRLRLGRLQRPRGRAVRGAGTRVRAGDPWCAGRRAGAAVHRSRSRSRSTAWRASSHR